MAQARTGMVRAFQFVRGEKACYNPKVTRTGKCYRYICLPKRLFLLTIASALLT
jgi:hypothetical protein